MRRGYTLIELLTSMSLLMVVFGLALPLFFMGDRALTANAKVLRSQGAAARLMGDLSRDLRCARAVSLGANSAQIDGIAYRTDANAVARQSDTGYSTYSGVRFTLTPQGRTIRITIQSGTGVLATTVLRRNR